MKLGILGAGNLGMALASNVREGVEVIAVKRKPVRAKFRVSTEIDAISECDVIFVTLKPGVFREMVVKIGEIAEDRPVVSFAAGVKLDEMRRHIENPFRAMTNLAVPIVAYYPQKTAEFLPLKAELMECSSEDELDAMTSYIGSSPGILAYLISAFVISALKDGIEYTKAVKLAVSAFKASAELYEKYGLEEMTRKIATPGGTTVEGIAEILDAQRILVGALSSAASKARVL